MMTTTLWKTLPAARFVVHPVTGRTYTDRDMMSLGIPIPRILRILGWNPC